jgi:hypothetical protein
MVTTIAPSRLWTVPTWLGVVNAGEREDDKQQDQRDEDNDSNLHPSWHAGPRSPVGPETTVWWHISHVPILPPVASGRPISVTRRQGV